MSATYGRHAQNTHFEWAQPDGPFRRVSPLQAAAYGRDGGFVLEDAFTAQEIAAVTAAIDPLEAQTEAFLATRPGGRYGIARANEITFRPHVVTQSAVLQQFARHPVFCDLVHDLIGPDVRLYWDQSVYKKPAAHEEFPWHQDNGYTYIEPQQYLTCWVALTRATVDNGCPWIMPGAHLQGTLVHKNTPLGFQCLSDSAGAVPLELDAGSVAVFSSLTPHRTGPNSTARVRKSYILQYAPDGAAYYPKAGTALACNADDRQFLVLQGGNPR
ncbi:MAG: phytanoyl-CoA dioxygenase family protein [Gammaproteobacteria bacterium]|nr:phytanoyl-CoA dioxygenase family protein [Gammaproteobacteria bacterium]